MNTQLAAMTEAVNEVACNYSPDATGACLVSTAALSYVALQYGITHKIMRDTHGDEAHWWLTAGNEVYDATRTQFGDLPLISHYDTDYVIQDIFEPGWTSEELVVAEAMQGFVFPEAAHAFAGEAIAAACLAAAQFCSGEEQDQQS